MKKHNKHHKNPMEYVHDIEVIDQNVRLRLRNIFFNPATPLGKLFDVVLMLFIIGSILTIVFHSIPALNKRYQLLFLSIDWFFTVVFFVEYCLRVYSAENRKKYIFSFWGIIDFLAVVPSMFSLWITGQQTIQVIRIIRLLRVFQVLRLFRFISEGYELAQIMKSSFYKIAVFMSFIFVLVMLLGSFMYIIEDGTKGFESIPASIYWGIVTITTVGFGDVTPATSLGKFISSIIMLAGYAIIAVPTAIMSGAIATGKAKPKEVRKTVKCQQCGHINDFENKFCSECGDSLLDEKIVDNIT